jgi:hypothetical protein
MLPERALAGAVADPVAVVIRLGQPFSCFGSGRGSHTAGRSFSITK